MGKPTQKAGRNKAKCIATSVLKKAKTALPTKVQQMLTKVKTTSVDPGFRFELLDAAGGAIVLPNLPPSQGHIIVQHTQRPLIGHDIVSVSTPRPSAAFAQATVDAFAEVLRWKYGAKGKGKGKKGKGAAGGAAGAKVIYMSMLVNAFESTPITL
mmetsp:Transcript_62573/g.116376  ORF Transcript_62573/g.116376 Transcript_62573/m.116376 type:complete len:155 (+) Transcript_62573:59-523(+)